MSEIKRWAFSVCIVLIASGFFMRILPQRSDKRVLRFVVTLILIVCVFEIDISSFSDLLEPDFGYESVGSAEKYEEELKDGIEDTVSEKLQDEIQSKYKKYDENAIVSVEYGNGIFFVKVSGANLSEFEKAKIQAQIENFVGQDTEFIYME